MTDPDAASFAPPASALEPISWPRLLCGLWLAAVLSGVPFWPFSIIGLYNFSQFQVPVLGVSLISAFALALPLYVLKARRGRVRGWVAIVYGMAIGVAAGLACTMVWAFWTTRSFALMSHASFGSGFLFPLVVAVIALFGAVSGLIGGMTFHIAMRWIKPTWLLLSLALAVSLLTGVLAYRGSNMMCKPHGPCTGAQAIGH